GDALEEVVLLDERQELAVGRPAGVDGGAGVGRPLAERKHAVGVVVVVQRQGELLEVVGALHPRRRLADLLEGGEQQADEDSDDGDHYQQLDQREGGALPAHGTGLAKKEITGGKRVMISEPRSRATRRRQPRRKAPMARRDVQRGGWKMRATG